MCPRRKSGSPVSLSKKKLWLFRFIVLCGVGAFGLIAGEVYLRLFDRQPIVPRYVELAPYGIRKNVADVDGYMETAEFRHGFRTNSQGFRGSQEYEIPKPPGVFRIIVLGDSVALGHGVEDDETFSAKLESRLSQGHRVEVINMGVSGFGTAEELIQLRSVGLRYQPDLVILGYFPNDPYNNVVSKLFRIEDGQLVQNAKSFAPAIKVRDRLYRIPGYTFLSQHSHLLNFLRRRASAYFVKKLGEENNLSSTTSAELTSEHGVLTAQLINAISDELATSSTPLIVLDIALFRKGSTIRNLPEELIEKREGVYIVDVLDQIYGDAAVSELSYERDCHPTPLGHRLIADWLDSFIRSEFLDTQSPEE